MSEGLGSTWYYVESPPRYSRERATWKVATATVVGETPRKWILRESHRLTASGSARSIPPAEMGWGDWTISKKGDHTREGCGTRGATRPFYETEALAQAEVAQHHAQVWAREHAYRIADCVRALAPNNAALLRKIGEMVGYKEEEKG